MNAITFYLPTGEIDSVLTGDQSVINETIKISELDWVEGYFYDMVYYVLNGQAVERPVNPTLLTGLTLTNVPYPCKIVINQTEYECNESEVELDFPMSGLYKIKVIAFPYLDAEFEIET